MLDPGGQAEYTTDCSSVLLSITLPDFDLLIIRKLLNINCSWERDKKE